MPITPAIIENETAETIWDAVQKKHPVPLWSLSALKKKKHWLTIPSQVFMLHVAIDHCALELCHLVFENW